MKKLSFILHLKHLKSKYNKVLKLLQAVAHTEWGGDQQTQIELYKSQDHSQQDYGSLVYR